MKKVNKLIFVDYLEVAFEGVLPVKPATIDKSYIINKSCYLEYKFSGTKIYKNTAELWIEGYKIGELRFTPRSTNIKSDMINFKFENELLYQQGYTKFIDVIIADLNLSFLYISRLDVAIDCVDHNIIKFVDNYLFKTSTNKRYSKRHKGKVKRDNIRTNIDSRLYWGSNTSDKYIKIYNKTEELARPNSDKEYIPKFWSANGLNTTGKTVERFELTLKQRHAKVLDYQELGDSNYLASIMNTHCKNFFDFEQTYINHGKKRKRTVTPLDFEDFQTVLLPKFKYKKSPRLISEKRTLRNLYFQYLQAEFIASDNFVASGFIYVPDIVKNYPDIFGTIKTLFYKHPQLEHYFKKKKSDWDKEFGKTNELATGKISIDDFVKSLHITVGNIADSHELKDTTGLSSYRINDIQLADLEGKIRSIEMNDESDNQS